jgi:hypothetical protein
MNRQVKKKESSLGISKTENQYDIPKDKEFEKIKREIIEKEHRDLTFEIEKLKQEVNSHFY